MGEAIKLISLKTGNKRSHFSGTHFSKMKRKNKCLFNILQTKDDWTLLLSDEILLKIFKYLPKSCLLNISSVCQRWNQISSDRILWRGIDISRKSVLFSDLAWILSKGVVALKMVGAKVHQPFVPMNLLVPSEGYQLSMLDATMASISTENLLAILSQCKKLEKLSLESCSLNDDICREIGANSRLTVLDISMCKGVTAEFISQLRLEELNVSCIKMDDMNFSYLVSHLPTTLKRLNMSGVFQSLDADIFTLCSSCPNLIELNVSLNKRLTNLTIDIVMKLLPNLQHLSISGCFRITLPKLKELASMKSLQTLNIHHTLKEAKVEVISKLLVGVQVNKSYFSTVARSFSRGENMMWGFPTDKF